MPFVTVSLLIGIQAYGVPSCGPWLITTLRALFWTYVVCAFGVAVGQYCFLFTAPAEHLTLHSMTPAWVLPISPV